MEKDTFIFGIYPVLEALRNGKEMESLFIKRGSNGELFDEMLSLARKMEIPVHMVPIEKLKRMTQGNHQGVVGIASHIGYVPVEEIITTAFEEGRSPLLVLLDGITDVRNFGAIARSAECAGADAIVFSSLNSAPVNAVAIKASAGALMHMPVCRVHNMVTTVKNMKNYGIKIIAASEKGRTVYTEYDFNEPTAIIMGAEDSGIDTALLKISDYMVNIPMKGKVKSLNVSVASGVLLFEALKQRMK
jgi:23S rRNA (guanosine2251-2'-O)-methyltransferase